MGTLVGGSAHIVCWYQAGKYMETYEFWKQHAKQYGLTVFDVPLIWFKSDGSGVVSDASRRYRHVYESALLISRGDRKIVRTVADVYAAPVSRNLHPSEKPEPMLRHFFRALVSNTTRLLDPTAGSASALRAAESLGAEFVFGLEKDPEFHKLATEELDRFRRKAALEKLTNRAEGAEKEEADEGRN
jgi:DNA modification methylase